MTRARPRCHISPTRLPATPAAGPKEHPAHLQSTQEVPLSLFQHATGPMDQAAGNIPVRHLGVDPPHNNRRFGWRVHACRPPHPKTGHLYPIFFCQNFFGYGFFELGLEKAGSCSN